MMMNAHTAAKISARIVTLVNNGYTVEQAINAVLGAGTYATLASDLYDALKAKGV